MTDLFARLCALHGAGHTQGHAQDDVEIIANPWQPPEGSAFRPSAVLAAITDRAEPGVILTYRPDTMRSHAGHIAFPGGKVDPGETALEAALREANEELGIDPAAVRLIGEGDRMRTGTLFEIRTIVGLVPGDVAITPNPHEVASWFEVPLAHVLDPTTHVTEKYVVRGTSYDIWTINWNGHKIWGATAMMLINIARRLNHGRTRLS